MYIRTYRELWLQSPFTFTNVDQLTASSLLCGHRVKSSQSSEGEKHKEISVQHAQCANGVKYYGLG